MTVLALIILSLLVAAALSAGGALIFMLVWNAALVGTFDWAQPISFWVAWGIVFLLGFVGNMFRATVKSDNK